jgi:putative ABC transport system permease protein
MDSPYITIFLNSTPALELVDCPNCNGDGCDLCDQTGKWGRYPPPKGGGIVIPQFYMLREDLNLTLYYDSVKEEWVGSNLTALYVLEGTTRGEYSLYVGPGHVPPEQGVQLQVIGVFRESSKALISLKDAWELKGQETDRWSSFIYVKIPQVTDFGKVNNELSRYYPQFGVWVLYPPVKGVVAVINILQWELPLVAGLVALLIFLNMMQMSIYERMREVGTMRALGAETTTAVMIFTMEGLVIGGIGGAVGYLVAVIISLVTKFGGVNPNLSLVNAIGPGKLILGLAFGLGIAFLGAALPAFFAIARSPDDALRGAK